MNISLMYRNEQGVSKGVIIHNVPQPNKNDFCVVELNKEEVKDLIKELNDALQGSELKELPKLE